MNVVVLAPIDNSLHARLILEQCHLEPGVTVVGIVVRRILNWKRIRQEWKRDGVRLIRKVWEKILLDNTEEVVPKNMETPKKRAQELGIRHGTVSRTAKARNIPLCWTHDLNASQVIEFLKEANPDVTLFSGGGLIRKELLSVSGKGVLNVHLGLLPEYRGMDVVEWPILMEGGPGLERIGLTLHFMDRGLDTGPILKTQPILVTEEDSFVRLRLRMAAVMSDLMMRGLKALRERKLEPTPQAKHAGRQFFVCHPRLSALVQRKLSAAIQSRKRAQEASK